MKYYTVEPEVAGGLGENTKMDRSIHPPIVHRLHYEFYGWLGDAIVASFPCFLAREEARSELECSGVTGLHFEEAEVTTSDEFNELFPDVRLPRFLWMRVLGRAREDDFGISPDGRLIVSERAVKVLQHLGISNALVTLLAD